MRLDRDAWNVIDVMIAPVVWIALLTLAYWAVPPAHEPGRQALLRGLHIGAFVLALVGLVLCVRDLRRTAGTADDTAVQRRRFLALAGIAVAALVLLVIAGMAVPTFLLWPGAEP